MQNKLFRQESLDRISSPEELHDYMRVTSPRLWMLLAAIAVLLVGFVVYASTATMENTVEIPVSVEFGLISAQQPEGEADMIRVDMPVRIADRTGRVTDINHTSELLMDIVYADGSVPETNYYELEGPTANLGDEGIEI